MGCSSSKAFPVTPAGGNLEEEVVQRHPLKESTNLSVNDFELLKTIRKSSCGKVYEVRMKSTGKVYAMKVLNKNKIMEKLQYENTLSERRILENISHPFLVCLRFAFQSHTKLFIVTDFFNGGELFQYLSLGRFSENRARFYAAEIALGLAYLHKNNIVYRDLKPENILLDMEGHICITDFGLSKEIVEGDAINSTCGSPEYLAPEVITKKAYGKSVDWWSLGTLIYEMLDGLPPFYDSNRKTMYYNICNSPLPRSPHISDEAFDICTKLLQRDPTKRLGQNGFEEIQNHPWFRDMDWDKLYRKEIEPPYKPNVKNEESTELFNSKLVSEVPMVTPTPTNSSISGQFMIENFSYAKSAH